MLVCLVILTIMSQLVHHLSQGRAHAFLLLSHLKASPGLYLPSLFFLKSLCSFMAAALACTPSYHIFLWPCNYTQSFASSCLFSMLHALSAQALYMCIQSFWFPRMRAFPVFFCRPFLVYVHILGMTLFQPSFVDYKVSLVHIVPHLTTKSTTLSYDVWLYFPSSVVPCLKLLHRCTSLLAKMLLLIIVKWTACLPSIPQFSKRVLWSWKPKPGCQHQFVAGCWPAGYVLFSSSSC